MRIKIFHKYIDINTGTDYTQLPIGTMIKTNKGLFPIKKYYKDNVGLYTADEVWLSKIVSNCFGECV